MFLRGGGWMDAQMVDQSLVEDGLTVSGGGVKYWWQERSPRARRRLGLASKAGSRSDPTARADRTRR